MDKFEGFTEEDIRIINTSKSSQPDQKSPQSSSSTVNAVYKQRQNKSRYHNRLSRKNVARERLLKANKSGGSCDNVPYEARLYIPQIPEEEEDAEDNLESKEDNKVLKMVSEKSCNNSETVSSNHTERKDNNYENEKKAKTASSVLNSELVCLDSLEEFESRQKLMEEQNRQRKEILKRALADRAKKTHQEVKRLNEIEGELKKLDLLLSNDVAIIRNQIESASIEFMVAQKRYDEAEKEFLDAKLDLFNRKERKELLTSHLCTIIEQNEMRKAKKLSDLMMQLEIGPKESLITSQIKVEYKNDKVHQSEQESIVTEHEDSRKENGEST